MRARPLIWLTLGLVLLVGVLVFRGLEPRPAVAPPKLPVVMPVATVRPVPVATTNQTTVSEATAPAFVAGAKRPADGDSTNQLARRLTNTTRTAGQLLRDDHAILLENALVDTSRPLGFSVPASLQRSGEPGSYIVQARGVVDNGFRAALAAAGATIVSYIPNNAYLVRASAETADRLAAAPQTQAVLPYEPVYKLKSGLFGLALDQSPLPPGTRLNLLGFTGARDELAAALQQQGMPVVGESGSPFGPVFTVQPPEGATWTELARLGAVQVVEVATARQAANDLSRVQVAVAADSQTTNNYLGLTGSNVLVNLNDSGVSVDHPDLVSRVFPEFPALGTDASGHGTFVAGIIAGDGTKSLTVTNASGSINPGTNSQYRGLAPAAEVYLQSIADTDQALQEGAARTNALISNNSWNYGGNTYGIADSSYDAAVRDALPGVTGSQPVLFVFSAGNQGDGNDDGLGGDPESVLSPGTAKNSITVGATELPRNITNEVTKITTSGQNTSTNTGTPWKGMTSSANQVAAFSSRGNVGIGVEGDFGRFKPDVVAPGTFVVSTRSTTWDEAAYYNPTSHVVATFRNLIVQTNANFTNSLFLPFNAVGFSLTLRPNRNSPTPFPSLPIFVRRDAVPWPLATAEFIRTNSVQVPPDGGGVGANVDQYWHYIVGNSTTQNVSFDLVTDVLLTNDLGDYYEVLSNLNNSISGTPPYYYRYESGTSMAAADVSGTLALMQEFFAQRMGALHITNSPALMKALLINGARSVGSLYDFEVQNSINYQGWGMIKLANSIPGSLTNNLTSVNTVSNSLFFFDQSPTNALATGQSQTRQISLNAESQYLPLRVTLVWTDPPGNPAAGVKLVNDLDLVVTNLDTGEVYFGNDIPANSTVTSAWDPNSPPNPDSVNNVENVYLNPAFTPLGSNYTVTVRARRVNVNAVYAQTNDVVQDYALVISSGNGEVPDALHLEKVQPVVLPAVSGFPEVTAVTNQFAGNPTVGGGILLNQLVGANTPLLGTTNGMTNQWHFYVITNTLNFTNAAFITFLPPTLSVPRAGVNDDELNNATRVEADIDLYVSQDYNLTNLVPAAVAAADKSRTSGGTEFIAYSNSTPGAVYYIGVKSEDQMASEYAFFAGFSLLPFSEGDGNGNWIVNGFPLPSVIPDGSPSDPGASLVLGLALQPAMIRRLVVTNSFYHQQPGDLITTLSHGQKFSVLSNHRSEPAGQYTDIYEDNDEEPDNPFLRHPDGPGKLRDFVGDQATGVWLLSTVDDSQSQTGSVNGLRILIEPTDTSGGVTNRIRARSFFYEVVDVPVGATNLEVCVNIVSANPTPLELYLRYEAFPTRTAYDHFRTINPPGACLDVTPADLPPLRPGRYFIGVYNPANVDQEVTIKATVTVDPRGVVPITWGQTGEQALLDDAITNFTTVVTNNARIAQVEVGLRIDHPRVSDLAVTLISPRGTRVLLVENRGGTNAGGFGSSLVVSNFVPVSADGGPNPQTNYVDTGATTGTVTINYDFFDVPDRMTVYYENLAVPILDTGMISGAGRFTVNYGPGTSTTLEIRMNEFGNTNSTTKWNYTVSSTSQSQSYLTFTENTNLTTTPIKFASPPFVGTTGANIPISGFEWPPTASGNYFGPAAGTPDGWSVQTTDPVMVVSNPPPADTGSQSLALRSGQLLRNLPTIPQHSYRLNFAHRRAPSLEGLVSWWPGDQTPADIVGTNVGTLVGGTTFAAGEVNSGFRFNGIDSRVLVADADDLDFTNAMTAEVWINPTLWGGTPREILSKWGGPSDQRSYTFSINTSGLAYFAVCSDGGFNFATVFSTTVIPTGQWTHLAATYDGANLRMYVNGVLESTVPWAQGIFRGTAPVAIGATLTFGTSATSFFNGVIDEPSVYRRALTAAEVADVYAAGAAGKCGMKFPPEVCPPVGAQIFVPGQVTNTFLGDTNWQTGGLIFRATANTTPVGLAPAVIAGHYYQFVRTNISWSDALLTAASLSTNGLTAHLATITSAAENDYLRATFGTNLGNEFAWIGGQEPLADGLWKWVTGPEANLPISMNAAPLPPFNYANWGSTAPNPGKVNADYLAFNLGTAFNGVNNGQWADSGPTNSATDPVVGFLVEFEPIPPETSGVLVDSFSLQEAAGPLYVLPEESLDILKGENAKGTWQLEIWDSRTGKTNNVSLVAWQLQFVFIPDAAAARGLPPCTPFSTKIPPGQTFYYIVDVPAPARFATNWLFQASGPLNFYFNQTVPPGFGGTNVGDVVFTNNATDCTRIMSANPTGYPAPPLLPGQRYYLAVENPGAVNVSYTVQVCFDLSEIPPSIPLASGAENCATNDTSLGIDYYRFTVSSNAVRAQFEIDNPSGDMTLLVRRELPPTFAVYDYLSANPFTSDELITVFDYSSPVALTPGDWYLGAANLSPGPVTYCIKATEWTEYGPTLVITNWYVSSNSFCLTWTSLPGVKYFVEGVTNLGSTNWVAVSPTLTATDYATTYCVPLPSPYQFFRVREGVVINSAPTTPVITRIEHVLNGYLLSWSGPVTAQYQVQWSPSLIPPPPVTWTAFTNPPVVTSATGLFQFLDDGSETGGFASPHYYRLLLLP